MHPTYCPSARSEGLVVEEVGDELLVYDRAADVAHCLTSVATTVWRHCDGEHDLDALTLIVAEQAEAGDAEELTLRAVSELKANGLLARERSSDGSLSRRQALQRLAGVGMAAAAAPLIVSALAPSPADAFSGAGCRNLNQTCTSATEGANGDCCGTTTVCTNGTGSNASVNQKYCKSSLGCTPGGSKPGGVNCTNSGVNHTANAACCSGFCGNGSNTTTCAA
jgi:hypothetical protein